MLHLIQPIGETTFSIQGASSSGYKTLVRWNQISFPEPSLSFFSGKENKGKATKGNQGSCYGNEIGRDWYTWKGFFSRVKTILPWL